METGKMFRKVDQKPVDVVKHTLEVLKQYPHADIHIGTDSQNKRKWSKFSIVIAYKLGTRGVHCIVHNYRLPKMKDKYTRLWREAEDTVNVAQWLNAKVPAVKIELDFDYNADAKYFSNKLVQAAVGWGESLGYKCNHKPGNVIATKYADAQCRS